MQKKPPLSAFFTLILLSTLLTFCSAIPALAALSWSVQTVDDRAYATQGRCPIALDSKGLPHIGYTNVRVDPDTRFQTPLVMYANWNGTVWSTQQIAIGWTLSLVLDADDHPHILYRLSWKPLMYASWTGSEWNIQTVDSNTFSGGGFGLIALDSHGNPHVAYNDGTTIEYAVSNGQEWTVQTVATDESGELPKLSFALDKNDTPYIMYSPSSYVYFPQDVGIQAINVTLATYQDSSWKFQPLSLPTPTDDYGSLIVDSKGGLHSIFTQNYVSSGNTIRTLMYGSWNGSGWDTQQVVSNIWLPYSVSLALDSRDCPHIICSNGVYASWTGTAWDVQATDVSGYLAVDADGNLHVSWNVARGGSWVIASLMYATATPTATPTSTPTHEPQQTNQTETILGLAIVVAVLGAGLGLLIYLIKRK